eukprot:scaffold13952_cov101-Isochrysis_galbana.AAC.1
MSMRRLYTWKDVFSSRIASRAARRSNLTVPLVPHTTPHGALELASARMSKARMRTSASPAATTSPEPPGRLRRVEMSS